LLLGSFWQNWSSAANFGHLSFVRASVDGNIKGFGGRIDSMGLGTLANDVLTEIQLFAGETAFHQRCSVLEELLVAKTADASDRSGSGEPAHIVAMRGRSHMFAYSDLERICKKVAQETGEALAWHS
jgi:hypothetical protein